MRDTGEYFDLYGNNVITVLLTDIFVQLRQKVTLLLPSTVCGLQLW